LVGIDTLIVSSLLRLSPITFLRNTTSTKRGRNIMLLTDFPNNETWKEHHATDRLSQQRNVEGTSCYSQTFPTTKRGRNIMLLTDFPNNETWKEHHATDRLSQRNVEGTPCYWQRLSQQRNMGVTNSLKPYHTQILFSRAKAAVAPSWSNVIQHLADTKNALSCATLMLLCGVVVYCCLFFTHTVSAAAEMKVLDTRRVVINITRKQDKNWT
jgi:hypothetical protein